MSILSLQKQSQNTDFPNLRPSLDLRFALAKKLDPRITFTRGSTGTYFGPDGLMKTAGVNEPRFDHDPITGQSLGLLIEESRTNLMTYSNDFTNPAWIIAPFPTPVVNQIGLDGTTSASTFTATPVGGLNYIYQSFTCTASTTYTFSFYVKLGTLPASSFKIAVYNNTGGSFIAVDVTPTQTLSSLFWTRVSYSFTTPAGCTSARVYPYRNANATQNNGTFYLWGAQVEAGAFPTSYVPTTASTVTRSADLASMTGTNFSNWYNQSEGTIFCNFSCDNWNSSNNFLKVFTINQENFGVEDNGFWIGNDANQTNSVRYRVRFSGINQFGPANLIRTSNRVKSAMSVKSSNFSITINGNNPTTSLKGTLSSNMSSLTIGRDIIGVDDKFLNGTISRLTYYPIKLTDQQLINLTS